MIELTKADKRQIENDTRDLMAKIRAEKYAMTYTRNLQKTAFRSFGEGYSEGVADTRNKAKEAFGKACGWLHVYPWYEAVVEEFVKAMEGEK